MLRCRDPGHELGPCGRFVHEAPHVPVIGRCLQALQTFFSKGLKRLFSVRNFLATTSRSSVRRTSRVLSQLARPLGRCADRINESGAEAAALQRGETGNGSATWACDPVLELGDMYVLCSR